jgi:hypothetical protein
MWAFYLAGVETIFSEDFMNFRIAQVELRKNMRSNLVWPNERPRNANSAPEVTAAQIERNWVL